MSYLVKIRVIQEEDVTLDTAQFNDNGRSDGQTTERKFNIFH